MEETNNLGKNKLTSVPMSTTSYSYADLSSVLGVLNLTSMEPLQSVNDL